MKKLFLSILIFGLTACNNVINENLTSIHAQRIYIEAKLKEHKAKLEEYYNNSMYYGREGLDFESHEKANIRMYEDMLKNLTIKNARQ